MMENSVSAIIRFHDPERTDLLARAVQSLHAQLDVAVQPIIVAQRFSGAQLDTLGEVLSEQWFFRDRPSPVVLNFADGSTRDARSDLLNLGIARHLELRNRYLAFLDYDDLLYTHAYRTLVRALDRSGAAAAFATVEVADVVTLRDYEFVYDLSRRYKGKNKLDLVRQNFCPLHSYLLDTSKLQPEELFFRSELTRLEDYDFLLRVACRHACDFSEVDTSIGLYFMRTDGTNSTPHGDGPVTQREEGDDWKINSDRLAALRSAYEVRFFASDF